jgi:hypothetical protein
VGCEDILDVDLPTRVPSEALDDPAIAATLVASVVADFECANSNYVAATGLLTDQLWVSTEFAAPSAWHLRTVNAGSGDLSTGSCNTFGGVYTPLSTARFQADDVYDRIQAFPNEAVPDKESLLATAAAYGGYSLTLLGEGFCSMAINESAEMQPDQVLQMAEDRFTTAIGHAQASSNDEILNMARVGRARVRLNLGDGAGAVADAQLVPAGFVKDATHSSASSRRENEVYVYAQRLLYLTVDPRYRDLEIDGAPDPRVPVVDAERVGHDGLTPLWLQEKYLSEGAPMRLASWEEAQLIIAEVQGGQEAVDAINRLRVDEGLPSFSSTDPTEIANQVIEERRREFFLEGQRLNDMLRLGLPFDTGLDFKGRPFGTTTCLPLPDVERIANPNIGG